MGTRAPSRLRVGCSSPARLHAATRGSEYRQLHRDRSGDLHNLPVGAPVDLKPRFRASLRALPQAGRLSAGTGNASLLLFAAQDGVEVLIQDPMAALQPLTVVASIPLSASPSPQGPMAQAL